MSLSADIQYPLLLKILTYDKNINSRINDNLKILVIYQSGFRKSKAAKDELANTIDNDKLKIVNKNVYTYFYDINEIEDLSKYLKENKIDLLYITPLRSINISRIQQIAEAYKIITFSSVPEYVEKGVAIGLDIKDDKPIVLINLDSARKVGCEFQSQLLKFSKVF